MGSIFGKLAALALSCVVSVLLLELGLRLAFDPMNYLKPDLLDDPILGWRIAPDSAGHDAWGFRNESVPDRAQLVAIGDSQTYGYCATSQESWPGWVAQLSGRSVYNLGIGGYGPAEYLHLLETKALALAPEQVVIGLYTGNDFFDAARSADRRPNGPEDRTDADASPAPTQQQAGAGSPPESNSPIVRAREWLRGHSLLMRVAEESAIGQRINAIGDRRDEAEGACQIAVDQPFPTVFKLADRFRGLDPDEADVRRGIDLSLQLLERMAERTDEAGARLIVVLIPTKEAVLAPHVEPVGGECGALLRRLVAAERDAVGRIRDFLEERGIPVVDPLASLSAAATQERIYLQSGDSHPNARGYRVIAADLIELFAAP